MPTCFPQGFELFKKRWEMHDDTGANDPRHFWVDQSYNAPGGAEATEVSAKGIPLKIELKLNQSLRTAR